MDGYTEIWTEGVWWVVVIVTVVIGLAGALGVLDRLVPPRGR